MNNNQNKKFMKEKILEAFRDLGFKLEEEEGMGYCFNYKAHICNILSDSTSTIPGSAILRNSSSLSLYMYSRFSPS